MVLEDVQNLKFTVPEFVGIHVDSPQTIHGVRPTEAPVSVASV